MKKFFFLIIFLHFSNIAAPAASASPISALDGYLSPSGPFIQESQLEEVKNRLQRREISAQSTETYTYLRCHYQQETSNIALKNTYKWAIDTAGNHQRVTGFWWPNSAISLNSIFYTYMTHEELREACIRTLRKDHIYRWPTLIAAANNQYSTNHTIWEIKSSEPHQPFDKVIAFGDSLSDSQNMFNVSAETMPNPKSWFSGRFTNGQVWIEYLADWLEAPLYNWAVGGAAADSYFVVDGLLQQVQSWREYARQDPHYHPANTLFTMLIGGNDLVQYGRSVDDIIETQKHALQNLLNAGARYILILNLPDVSKAPIFKLRSDDEMIQKQVAQYNEKLQQIVIKLQRIYGANIKIRLFDFHTLLNDVLVRPSYYNLRNVTQSCLNTNSIEPGSFLLETKRHAECTDPEDYLFWDMLHPTTHAHLLLALSIYDFIPAAFGVSVPVQLPAATR